MTTLPDCLKPGSREVRAITIDRAGIDADRRTVELAFSSEQPYTRWWGDEILDHQRQSIRLDRLASGGPLLMDHDTRDHIGVIESVRIDDDLVGRAVVRFGKSARAQEIFDDVLDGIRRHVSVGYVIHKAQLVETKDDREVYRVTDWEPLEVSLVSVPADASVGVGRSGDDDTQTPENVEIPTMTNTTQQDPVTIDPAEYEARGAKAEAKRAKDIIAIGEQFKLETLAAQCVRDGTSVAEFQSLAMKQMSERAKPTATIGLTDQEARSFSFVRAINALVNPGDRKAQDAARFEREVSDAVGAKLGRSAQGFFVPFEVQNRDLTVGSATAGGNTVGTSLLAASFIELLRNRMALDSLGVTMLTGLMGNISIPRQTGGATAYWVAESGAPTESAPAFDQVSMSPKTVGAFVDISRKLLLQSSIDIEAFVRNDLARVLALEIDRAGINGTGADNQPRGILNTAGIGSVVGGTDGLAPTWAHIVDLWSDVAVANADVGRTGYLTNSKVAGKLMTTEKAGNTAQFVCPGFPDATGFTSFGGARARISNQVPSNLDKGTSTGVCSAIIFGNFADVLIGMWGTLDVTVDPYTASTSGTVRVVALQDVDVAVRHAESFAAMKDALTA